MLDDNPQVRHELSKRLESIKRGVEWGDDLGSIGTDFDVLASFLQSEDDLTAEFLGEEEE